MNCEQKVIDIIKEIKYKNKISEDQYNKLRPVGSQSMVLQKSIKKVIVSFPAF